MTNGITFVRDDAPGIRRKGTRRFRYVDARGREVSARERERINALAIPPAWTNVWISPDPSSHIQATGRDARGRKQYRYHDEFRRRREHVKFKSLREFGVALGALRKRVDADLRSPALTRTRVLAAVVCLLDQTFVRVGNEGYARTNKTFGLTTLRCKHVDVTGARLRMQFTGKGGKAFDVSCCDARLARVVRRCQDLPGQLLFQYESEDGTPAAVSSGDLNEYLRETTGLDVTAKTFRTWAASVMAAEALAAYPAPQSPREFGSSVKEALTPVANALGNTVAVCRSSYVHPVVLRAFENGTLADKWEAGPSRAANRLSVNERKLLALLS